MSTYRKKEGENREEKGGYGRGGEGGGGGVVVVVWVVVGRFAWADRQFLEDEKMKQNTKSKRSDINSSENTNSHAESFLVMYGCRV